MTSNEQFEAWYREIFIGSLGPTPTYNRLFFQKYTPDIYKNELVQAAWSGWEGCRNNYDNTRKV